MTATPPVISALRARYQFRVDVALAGQWTQAHGGRWPVPDGQGQYWPLRAVLESVYTACRAVPGIHAKRGGAWYGPSYDIAWFVQRQLDAWRLPYTVDEPQGLHHPRPWSEDADEGLREAIREAPGLVDWLVQPGGPFQLADFQRAAIWYALERDGAMWDVPPGGGKTVCATVLSELGPPGPVLHVTKNTVTTQYARAVAGFTRSKPFEMPAPSAAPVRNKKRVDLGVLLTEYIEWCEWDDVFSHYQNGRPHVVVGWDTLRHALEALRSVRWATIVYDESQNAKSTKRWHWVSTLDGPEKHPRLCRSYAAYALATEATVRPHAMTGTPQHDRRRDWWGQLSLVSNGYEDSSGRFDKRYCGAQQGTYGWEVKGMENTVEFNHRKSMICYSVPQEVVDAQLPPRRLQVVRVSAANQDKPDPWFNNELRRLAKLAGRGDLSARGLLHEVKGMEAAARKTTAAVSFIEDYALREPSGGYKGKVVSFGGRHAETWELAQALTDKLGSKGVDVFCGVRPLADLERQMVTNRTGREVKETRAQWIRRVRAGGFELIEGQERQDLQDQYMAHPGPCVLVATGQAWGTGLDLQDSDLLLITYIPHSPGDLVQWMRRVQRLGMTRPCLVALMVADGTSDDRRAAILVDKTPDIAATTSNQSLGEVRDRMRGYDDETKAQLIADAMAAVDEQGTGDAFADEEMALWESLL